VSIDEKGYPEPEDTPGSRFHPCLRLFRSPEGRRKFLSEMDRAFREEISVRDETDSFFSWNLKGLRSYLDHRNFKELSSLIDLKIFKIRNTGFFSPRPSPSRPFSSLTMTKSSRILTS
jgi:hypothetical protein